MEDILRKYIRYILNEKPFNPELVANLIQLRKASALDDSKVAEILNDISRRIVRDKGNFSDMVLSFLLCLYCPVLPLTINMGLINAFLDVWNMPSPTCFCV